ncbi:MAG: catalase family peroxidase [Alphaproteobacteria bacterium]|nr:catalase family peroxidase [Alphaproteobacteria bacterium]
MKNFLQLATALTLTLPLAFVAAPVHAQSFDPIAAIDSLEGTFGVHARARRSHAKGVCVAGRFEGSAEGRALSAASLFSGAAHPVIGRFSVGGGNPRASDKGRAVRGFAFETTLPGNEVFVTTMLSAPVFFVSKPEHFAPFIASRRPDPATGMPNPERVRAFNEAHPDTRPQIEYLAAAPIPASYAATNYWGIHAFRFVEAAGTARNVKWSFEPVGGTLGLTAEQIANLPNDFLVEEIMQRVGRGPVAFDMTVQIAEPGDDVTSPVVTWPATRAKRTVGRLTIDRVDTAANAPCVAKNFDPNLLPRGIDASDDPVLRARSPSYAISTQRRS